MDVREEPTAWDSSVTSDRPSPGPAMASSVTKVEEIQRPDLEAVPQIRLKIISLNINERSRSLSPPSRMSEGAVRRSAAQRISRRHIHKLRSYDHLVRDLPIPRRAKRATALHNAGSGRRGAGLSGSGSHEGEESVYLFFVQGFRNAVKGDQEEMLRTILELLSDQAVSVARHEPLFLCEKEVRSPHGHAVQHAALHGALLALNEALDPGVFDISRSGMVGLGQCLTVTIFFHDHLAVLSHHAWNSPYIQALRDAWMGFGCLGAMVIMSMRQ